MDVSIALLDLSLDDYPKPDKAAFRQRQLYNWLFEQGVHDFANMTNLPKAWRAELAEGYYISPFSAIEQVRSADESVRYLFTLHDGKQTEAVYMPYSNRKTVCISSMVGCPAGCAFCATGALGFARNLSSGEILGQILAVAWGEGFAPKEIRNVVLMGMGEALLNYDNALAAIKTMIDPNALDMSPRRITLSTVGIPKQMRRMADEGLPLVLALSLHAPDDETRKKIIPTAQAFPISQIMDALRYWDSKVGRRITVEYTMLAGVNDHDWQADGLIHLLKKTRAHVNLIPFNPWTDSGFRESPPETIQYFRRRLDAAGISVSVRFSRGRDAGAACGQLALGNSVEPAPAVRSL